MIVERLIFSKHLEKGEKVMYSVHRHWIVMLKPVLFISFFGFLIPWTLYFIGLSTSFFFWIALTWSILAYLRFLYILIDWYSDVWLVTSMAILVIEWNGFFSNVATRIGYEDIEGVAYEIKGFWGTVMRYGDLTLKVMSGNNMVLTTTTRPQKAELAIMRYQDQYMNDREMHDAGSLKDLLSQMVTHYMRKQ